MEYLLDKKIRFTSESEYQSLYKWSLFEHTGEPTGKEPNLIPWNWSLHFSASRIKVVRWIEKAYHYRNETTEGASTEQRISIRGDLFSGYCNDGESLERAVTYSMFGTNRGVKSFDLEINCIDEPDVEEYCHMWGTPSYKSEIDFRTETVSDTVVVNIFLNKDRFFNLVELIESKKIDYVGLTLSKVSGFYDTWSPSVTTRDIKILTDSHVVENQDEYQGDLPILGSVGEFALSFITYKNLNLKNNFRPIDAYGAFDTYQPSNLEKELEKIRHEESIEYEGLRKKELEAQDKAKSLLIYKGLADSIKLPLWLLFIATVLLLVK